MRKVALHLFIVFSFFYFHQLSAAPAVRQLQTEELPDNTLISYYVEGDEREFYVRSTDGYTLLKNERGFYVYAQKGKDNSLMLSTVRAHNEEERSPEEQSFLKTLPLRLADSIQQHYIADDKSSEPKKAKSSASFSPFSSSNPDAQKHKRNIVILVEFSDLQFTVENPLDRFQQLLNRQGYNYNGATGSARDYFVRSSFEQYQPTFDVVGPYRLSNTMSHYAANDNRNREMIIEACLAADSEVDFSLYATTGGEVDNVCVIYAGNNAAETTAGTYIWPHSWFLANRSTQCDEATIYRYMCTSELRVKQQRPFRSEVCGIGTFVHEFSHLLGLPDMYNVVSESRYCLGEWDLMDEGLYNNEGRTPPLFSSYERFYMGWITPEVLTPSANIAELRPLDESNSAYIISQTAPSMDGFTPSPTEFFLLENRQQQGFDAYLPHHGMLIWHINFNRAAWDNNMANASTPGRVYMVAADDRLSLNTQTGDAFPGTAVVNTYIPTLWSGTSLNCPLYNISEQNGLITFTTQISVGIENLPIEMADIRIWSSQKQLYIEGADEKMRLQLLQTDGKILDVRQLNDSRNVIPVPRAGLYLLHLRSEHAAFACKIVVL